MALGTQREDVLRWVFLMALQLTVAGVIIGGIASLAANRLVSSYIAKVATFDPLTLNGVVVTIMMVDRYGVYQVGKRHPYVDREASRGAVPEEWIAPITRRWSQRVYRPITEEKPILSILMASANVLAYYHQLV